MIPRNSRGVARVYFLKPPGQVSGWKTYLGSIAKGLAMSRLVWLANAFALLYVLAVGSLANAAEPVLERFNTEVIKDVAYRELCPGEDVSLKKNLLDLYLPKGKKDVPVLFFVHGGAWRQGDKDFLGMYSSFGQFWARQGVATVVMNYRLSPAYKHPAHIEDVAAAFAWTRKNITRYGGRPEQIIVSGHSAGGHLVSLLATDERYLQPHGLTPRAICAAVPISGVFQLIAEHSDYSKVNTVYVQVFGQDQSLVKTASPITHVGSCTHPPFLIIYADKDLPTFDKQAEDFCKCLKEKRCHAETLSVKDRNHISVLLYGTRDEDPVAQAMAKFIAAHANDK